MMYCQQYKRLVTGWHRPAALTHKPMSEVSPAAGRRPLASRPLAPARPPAGRDGAPAAHCCGCAVHKPPPLPPPARLQDKTGHRQPIVAALYNKHFDTVVSVDEGGSTCVWGLQVGDLGLPCCSRHARRPCCSCVAADCLLPVSLAGWLAGCCCTTGLSSKRRPIRLFVNRPADRCA